jgi:probable phosphoglycerate mutase
VELLLIRHALPVRVELEAGAADPELSADGRRQAEHLAGYLTAEHLDAVYASPQRRARQTAEPIVEARGLTIVTRAGVAEWDQNSPEYVPVEELQAANDPRWQAMLDGEWGSDEPAEEFRARAIGTVEEIIGDHPGQRVAVVCHGGVINAYLAHVLGIERAAGGFFYPNYTSIHRVAAASSGERSVVTINETSHLRGTGLPVGLFQRS